MDSNSILCWLIGMNSAFALQRMLKAPAPRRSLSWILLLAGSLLLLGALLITVPERAGIITGPIWGVFVAVPMIAAQLGARALWRGQPRWALVWLRLAAFLHPFDGWRAQPRLAQLHVALQDGDFVRVRQLAEAMANSGTGQRGFGALQLAALDDDWQAYLDRFDDSQLGDVNGVQGLLTALGRTGRIDALLRAYRDLALPLMDSLPPFAANGLRATVAAAAGSVDVAEHAVRRAPLAQRGVMELNVVRALFRAGRQAEADERLDRLLKTTTSPSVRVFAERLQAAPHEALDRASLQPESRAILAELEAAAHNEVRFALTASDAERRPVFVWSLATILAAVFALEVFNGGPTNNETLVRLGALVMPQEYTPGEWWRPYTAAFLHFGWWHFALNLLGLLVLGGPLERVWSRAAVIVCYVSALLVSSSLVAALGAEHVQVFVGASGGIMGLLGALAGRLLVGHVRGSSALLRRQLRGVVSVVLLQLVFDASTPNVSSTAHMSGFLTGFVIAALITARQRREPDTAQR